MEDFPLIAGFTYVCFGIVEGHLNKRSDTPFIRLLRGVITWNYMLSEHGILKIKWQCKGRR